jgi:hypothetical protein
MMEPLPAIAEPESLTQALRRSGVLDRGRVCDVAVESSQEKLRSRTIRLRLTYDGAAPTGAPGSLVLKAGLPNRGGSSSSTARHPEVAFYNNVASIMSERLVPRCFDAGWDPGTKGWHVLLEDLTDTHFIATTWPLPPTMQQCESIIQTRARFHAAWWDDPRLGVSLGIWRDADVMDRRLRSFAEQFARFTDRHGELMSTERRELYERLLQRGLHLFERYLSHRNLTIIHGDAHVWNCFLPRDAEHGDVLLFDWEDWGIYTGTTELAYMMAMHWYPDRRHQLERPLLDHYHATLLEHGVSGYDRQALDEDYRLSALWQIMRPVGQEANNIPPRVWWNNLERALLAVDDLGCRDLLV